MEIINIITLFTCIYFTCAGPIKINPNGIKLPPERELTSNTNCLTVPFAMPIGMPGCKNITIQNNFCIGFCNSLFVPIKGTKEPIINTCLFCRPETAYRKVVFLQCTEKEKEVRKPVIVTIVANCHCGVCHKRKGINN